MARSFQVRTVALVHADPPHRWSFPAGVTIIAGAVGGGKTSLLNLIKYGLGGSATLTEEVRDAGSGVEVSILAGDRRLVLRRDFNRNVVHVSEDDRPEIEYAVEAGSQRPLLSELLLKAIGIPLVEVPKARSAQSRSRDLSAIGFQDVLSFSYLDQEQVDRSTMRDSDSFLAPKRFWIFELLHGLIDASSADLTAQSYRLQKQRDVTATTVGTVRDFAQQAGLVIDNAHVEARLAEIANAVAALTVEIDHERALANAAPRHTAELRERLSVAESQLIAARREEVALAEELEGIAEAINQLESDRARHDSGESARRVLEPLMFSVCPRCEQAVSTRDHDAGRCFVCLQPDRPLTVADSDAIRVQLTEQLSETLMLRAKVDRDLGDAHAHTRTSTNAVATLQRELAERVGEATAPHLQRVVELREQVGRLVGERAGLEQSRHLASAIEQADQAIQDDAEEATKLDLEAAGLVEELEPARQRVEELSEAFDEILRRFTLPWLKAAEVDRHDYLPRVNGRKLRDLSSGGMKATTNVAYYLAVLVNALRDRDVLALGFLMLDSIRKDYGAGEQDMARAERIYEYIETLQKMRNSAGALSADFQLILVDNDVPPTFAGAFNIITISPETPLIRGRN